MSVIEKDKVSGRKPNRMPVFARLLARLFANPDINLVRCRPVSA